MNENSSYQEPESFIVQNVTLGPLHISDIRMNFAPLQAIDLTWEDPKVIKASKDLRSCLRIGYLKKISPEQFESIEEKHAMRERKELLRQQSEQKLETVDVDGREMTAENIDALRGYNKENSVSTAGYANDSLSYAIALDVAQTQAQLRGDELSVEQFAEQVQKDPALVGRLIDQQKNLNANSNVSGREDRGRAYVATPPDSTNLTSGVAKLEMTNMNRDRRLAGSDASYLDIDSTEDDFAIAEAIDLEAEAGADDKGSVRRV
jgi:hypothetical protein